MKRAITLLLAGLIELVAVVFLEAQQVPVDLILTNGKIITVDDQLARQVGIQSRRLVTGPIH